MTVAIAFNAGSYGTYLEWCLTTLTTDSPITQPFNINGNSHKFLGAQLLNIDGWEKFLLANKNLPFVRFHPKTQQNHSLSDIMDRVCSTADSTIYLYPDRGSVLLSINNYINKIFDRWWEVHLFSSIDPDQIYKNWPVDPNIPPEHIPQWIRREFLSYYLMPAWFDQVEWYHLDRWQNHRACVVTVKDLLFNFESSMIRIQKHCNLKFVRPLSDLLPYHNTNLQLQKYINQDTLCDSIIKSITESTEFSWSQLPFGSEIWLQWELRNRGFEIRCDGLDTFPTNSLQLRELLYPV